MVRSIPRAFVCATFLIAACSSTHPGSDPGDGGESGDAGSDGPSVQPAVCSVGCPMGYTCDNGVCQGGSATALLFQAATVPVSGTLSFAGAPYPSQCNASTVARINFTSRTGASFSTDVPCPTSSGVFSAKLEPGTYVVTAYASSDLGLPDGTFVLDPALTVAGARSDLAYTASTVAVAGTLKFAGAPYPAQCNASTVARINFTSKTGASFSTDVPCPTSSGAFSAKLAPGSYVVTAYASSDLGLPEGTFVLDPALTVTAAKNDLAYNPSTVTIGGTLKFAGAPYPAQCNASTVARVNFTSTTGASFSTDIPCPTSSGAFSAKLAPGTYVVTAYASSNLGLPDGTFVLDPALTVTAAKNDLAYNPSTVTVGGTLKFAGTPYPAQCNASTVARVNFTSTTGASFSTDIPCPTSSGAFSAKLAPGTYVVTAYASSNLGLPDGTFVLDPALTVTAATNALAYNPSTVTLSGKLSFAGAAYPAQCDASTVARINFNSYALPLTGFLGTLGIGVGASFSTDIACPTADGTFTAHVAPGTYRISAYASSNLGLPDGTFDLVDQIALP